MSTPKTQKRRRGRPRKEGGREKFTTTLPEGFAGKLQSIGEAITGERNASAAIVQLVQEYEKRRGARA